MSTDYVKQVKDVAQTTNDYISKATVKTSLTRMTKDLVWQFSLLMPMGIEDDEIFPIVKSIEKNNAALVQAAIMADGMIDRNKHTHILDYLKQFHNNSTNKDILKDLVGSVVFESTMTDKEKASMWASSDNVYDNGKLNDIHLPFKSTTSAVTHKLEAAMEAATTFGDELFYARPAFKTGKNGTIKTEQGQVVYDTDSNGNIRMEMIKVPKNAKEREKFENMYGEPKTAKDWGAIYNNIRNDKGGSNEELLSRSRFVNKSEIVREDKYNALNPTMLKLTVMNVKENVGVWPQEIVLGVRCMPRRFTQEVMVHNMVQAFKDRPIFTFIKWTKGELKVADIFLGVSKSKELATMKGANRILGHLKSLARLSILNNLIGKKTIPNVSIIITALEAQMIKDQCGIDPYDSASVRKVISKYFLYGFGIYDTENKMLSIIYDGQEDYSVHSLRSLIADTKREMEINTRR